MSAPAIELLAIGDELLLGETLDTNSRWIAHRLARAGIRIAQTTTVGDEVGRIRTALAAALARSGTVVCTGGLGPTIDDVTRHAVAELYGRRIVIDEAWIDVLRERYRVRGIPMPEINRVQGELPEGARALPNPRGTAPAIVIDDPAIGMTVLLPGVPSEMRGFMDDVVVELLRERLGARSPILIRLLRTAGLSEAALADSVADLVHDTSPVSVAFLPHTAGVDLRLSCDGGDADARRRLEQLLVELRDRVGTAVYAEDDSDLAAVVGELLRARGLTLAVAESCTAGMLGKRLTDAAGASAWLLGGFIVYADAAKRDLLGVEAELLAEHGAVSEACARAMARGARRRVATDVGLSITGIAGPGGGSAEKPVGTTWIGIDTAAAAAARRFVFPGDRAEVRERATQAALDLLRRTLLRD
jgi:nicotinamide-nucleotide amidase